MKTILITGGAGFIGTNLTKQLLKENHKVLAVDNMVTSGEGNIQQFEKHSNFTFIKHDIYKPFPKTLISQLSSLNSIYHLACPTGVTNLGKLAEEMLYTCAYGTSNILDLAKKYNANVVFTSSSEVYGDPKEFPQTEEYNGNVDTIGIRSPYEEGKRFAESMCAMYWRKYKVDVKIARIFNTYGPYMSPNDTRVIPQFIQQIKKGEPLTVQGDGLQTRTFCYAEDTVGGLLLINEKGKAGEVYNLGGDIEITILQLAKMMLKISNAANKIEFVKRPSHDHQARRPSLQKIKNLGWTHKISLEDGLKRLFL